MFHQATNCSLSFHSTSDARKALALVDQNALKGVELDLQVPERFRSDSQGVKKFVERKNSGTRNMGYQNSFGSNRHNSSGRRNSFRKERVSSGLGHDSYRRNSIFSPQDARSDIPDPHQALQQQEKEQNNCLLEHGDVMKAGGADGAVRDCSIMLQDQTSRTIAALQDASVNNDTFSGLHPADLIPE